MKKEYEKPQILVEDYNITDLLATSPCEQKVNYADGSVCHSWFEVDITDDEGMPAGVGYLFNSGNAACTGGYMDQLGSYKGICYHGPENNNFFTS
ncbi:MAG: hypothetical protein ACLSAJ_03945 [Intestinibacter bartlettii]|uniref:hypothetical protein n=1 Tax=Intestinibacter bartlettii TaxID=261299 RepID=UPI00399F50E1